MKKKGGDKGGKKSWTGFIDSKSNDQTTIKCQILFYILQQNTNIFVLVKFLVIVRRDRKGTNR